jgi:hypothetical protein
MNEQQIKKIFTDQKKEMPDDGFTRRAAYRLPERVSLFPQLLMGICAVLAAAFLFILLSSAPVREQIGLLVD